MSKYPLHKETKPRFSFFQKPIEFINSAKNNNTLLKSIEIDSLSASAVLEETIIALSQFRYQ